MENPNTKILLVDDNEVKSLVNQKIIKRKLNIDCKIVQSGLDALRLLNSNNYNIIVLDILMPKMDGFELAAKIKEYCDKKKIKLPHMISYTVLEGKDVQEKAVICGITDYVSKGNQEELIKAIERWMVFDNNSFSIC